ncbi:MAG: hypothetical protein EP330_20350 [Deltaproteobacteria bacterium]|nr:MAG: hypothetical protein EP330_20350 [Deltaproteobacteria bacterium]
MRNLWIYAPLAFVIACGGSETTNEPAHEPEPAAEAAPAPAADVGVKVLAPSPLTLESEVKEAGLLEKLKIPAPKTSFDDPESKDRVAFQTGMLLAYTVLGGRETDKETFLVQVKALREGMGILGTGKGQLATIDEAITQVENDTAAREDFLEELDAQVGMAVPEDGVGPGDTSGYMLQAGAWLAGIDVVAKAVVETENADAADKLLKRPEVADFFLKYIKEGEGADKAGMMAGTVAASLEKLKEVSSRDTIGVEGARETVTITGDLLKKF